MLLKLLPSDLTTGILNKARSLNPGVYTYDLGGAGYVANDLPNLEYRYGCATIINRNYGSITVILTGATNGTPLAINITSSETAWYGWKTYD